METLAHLTRYGDARDFVLQWYGVMRLILYHFESCPYCEIVQEAIDRLKVPGVEYRDILKEPKYKQELIQMNGIRQVPCLVVDGKPMLESEDIVAFLEHTFGPSRRKP